MLGKKLYNLLNYVFKHCFTVLFSAEIFKLWRTAAGVWVRGEVKILNKYLIDNISLANIYALYLAMPHFHIGVDWNSKIFQKSSVFF